MLTRIKVLCQHRRRTEEPFEYAPGYVFVTDPDCREYDWLVAYDELHRASERLACPREHTILVTAEPTSIKSYSRAYTRQFGHLLTNRPFEAERHPHWHLGRGYYYWFIGRSYQACREPVAVEKNRVISACISAKKMGHTRHGDRFALMEALMKSVPGLDWFGRGVRSFGHKYEVLEPYRYHVVVENHIAPYHWSEKIADAFLGECLPFYAGDPLLGDVFPPESFIPIPIDDPAEAARIINAAIVTGEYEKRRSAILDAKRLVLERYNFWAQVIDVINSEAGRPAAEAGGTTVLYGRREVRLRHPSALWEDACSHLRQYVGFGVG